MRRETQPRGWSDSLTRREKLVPGRCGRSEGVHHTHHTRNEPSSVMQSSSGLSCSFGGISLVQGALSRILSADSSSNFVPQIQPHLQPRNSRRVQVPYLDTTFGSLSLFVGLSKLRALHNLRFRGWQTIVSTSFLNLRTSSLGPSSLIIS